MHNLLKKLFLAVILLLFVIAGWVFIIWLRFENAALIAQPPALKIKVARGSSIKDVARQLQQRGLINYPKLFIMFARAEGAARQLKYGEYMITPQMSAYDLLMNMAKGRGLARYQITFVEGWTFVQIKQVLNADHNLVHDIQGKTNAQIMKMLGHPGQHPEGRFYPETYTFTWGDEDLEVLSKAYSKMKTFLQAQWVNRAEDLPYKDAYQALIVASLVEKETALASERPVIAGVIIRRLHKGMRLQIDPTVLYGLNKPYSAVITRRDLRKYSPYNTYRINGLPPTPIDMPSSDSILAALHPTLGNALYYVARGDGSHEFSVTYKEHLAAVARYRRQRAEQSSYHKGALQKLKLNKQWTENMVELSVFLAGFGYL